MARFGVGDADKYGGQGGGGYFSLKDDKDTAEVRFLYDGIDDVEGFAVHEVEVDGKKRYVNCLREYGQPMDVCPFCKANMFTAVKYFVPLYDVKTGKVLTWERGKKFGGKLSSMCARYPHLVSHTFEIERNGKAKDTATTYEIYETGCDENVTLEDFEIPEILGGHVMEKTADEMLDYLQTGSFGGDEASTRRGSYSDDDSRVSRRTPSSGRGDRF